MLKMRTIPQLVKELKDQDPETPISESFIRKLVKQNKIPYITANSRIYISVEAFEKSIQSMQPLPRNEKIVEMKNIRMVAE